MKYIEKLLNGAEVKWMPLGEVAEIKRGKSLQKSDIGLGDIPIILYGELYTTYGNYIEKVVSHTSLERANNATLAVKSNLLLPLSSTTKEAQIGKASVLCTDEPVYIGGDALILSHSQDAGYLVHLINSGWFEKRKMRCVKGTTIMHLSPKELLEIPIPIPPLAVQEEITRILDKFTTLEAELEAELDCRKRQYEYYRNQLLSFSNDVEWKSLGNVFDFRNGKGHEKEIVPAGEFIVINSKFISSNGLVVKFSNRQLSPVYKGDILMVMSDLPNGKALAKCFLVDKDSTYTLNQRVCGLTIKNSKEMNPKFAFYILSRNKHLLKYNNGVDQTNLRKDDILKISIPIPSLAEQQRIVSILDKFEALTTSISEGLPKEIELRRKQYEYYRNQLLSFA